MAQDSKKDNFKRVASRRVQKVLDDLEILANCANKTTYEYSDADVKKMMKAINDKVQFVKMAFDASNGKASKQTFEF